MAAGGRILLVEDDAELREALIEMLDLEGFEVVGVENGREALDYLHSSDAPDLILLDLMLPVMDGWQFRMEQRRDQKLVSIPVLAISADDSPRATSVDANMYLKKPFGYFRLLNAVKQVMRAGEARPPSRSSPPM